MAKNTTNNRDWMSKEVEAELAALVSKVDRDQDACRRLLDSPAFYALVKRVCQFTLRRYARQDDRFDIDELTQEVYLHLFKNSQQFDLVLESVKSGAGYIAVVANKCMLDKLRKSKAANASHDIESGPQHRGETLLSHSYKSDPHFGSQELRAAAIRELESLSCFLDSDPELVDSTPVEDVIVQLQEIGLDINKPLLVESDVLPRGDTEQAVSFLRSRETGVTVAPPEAVAFLDLCRSRLQHTAQKALWVMHCTDPKSHSEDVLSNVLQKMIEHWEALNSPEDSLYMFVVNTARDHVRNCNAEILSDIHDSAASCLIQAGQDPEEMLTDAMLVEALLARLAPEERKVIELIFHQHSPTVIGELLGMPPNTIRSIRQRATDRLKEIVVHFRAKKSTT